MLRFVRKQRSHVRVLRIDVGNPGLRGIASPEHHGHVANDIPAQLEATEPRRLRGAGELGRHQIGDGLIGDTPERLGPGSPFPQGRDEIRRTFENLCTCHRLVSGDQP